MKTIIYTRLRILLAERDMRQKELAEKTGISTERISNITCGNWNGISRRILLALCEALDCQPGDLFIKRTVREDECPKIVKGKNED